MNNFPAMTEERRQELIDFMQGSRTYRYEEWSRLSKLRDQITLAALTVEPVGWMVKYGGIDKEMFVDKQAAARLYHDVTENGFLDVAMLQLYIAPPAPVLRVPDELKVKNGSHQSHIDYAEGWADCIDEVKRLNAQPSPPEASNEQ